MKAKRVYFPPTTAPQRKLLFETWEQTKNVTLACRKAHVGRTTFYYWKPCFAKAGYAGLENYDKVGVPEGTGRIAADIAAKVLALHGEHADWGKHRLAHEIAKANNWVPLISPNTVRHVLEEAQQWHPRTNRLKKNGLDSRPRTADRPGQTLNVDIAFVPFSHPAALKLPAVSGSSGHLVSERGKEAGQEPDYPGQVFTNPALDYAEAMQAFVQASQPLAGAQKATVMAATASPQAEIQQLRQQEDQLCLERRATRKRRETENAAWKMIRTSRQATQVTPQPKTRAAWGSCKALAEQQKNLRDQHRQQTNQRKQEDAKWREDRENLRKQMSLLPIVTAWIAILVVTDNCTRQCLGLPIFVAGAPVTSEMIVAALRILLPANLQFLISDRGIHFTAEAFQKLAQEADFVHVVIARHRPPSNGIAERLVRTLKAWLADKTWSSDKELAEFIHQFLFEYNDRPHQGLPLPGLSPNEYANRVWAT